MNPAQERRRLLWLIGAGLLVFLPLLPSLWLLMDNCDFLQLCTRHAFFRKSVLGLGQLALRCPYLGGGYPVLGDPEDPSLSPFALYTLLFGEAAGLKFTALTIFSAGLAGMYLLARRTLGYSFAGAVFCALGLAFGGWFHARFAGGNVNELYYFFVPPLLYLLSRAGESRLCAAGAALLFSAVIMDGEALVPVLALFLVCWAALHSFGRGERPGPAPVYAALGVLAAAALLSACKLLPALELLAAKGGAYPDIYTHSAVYSAAAIDAYTPRALLGFALPYAPWMGRFVTYGLYIGPAAAAAGLAGFALCRRGTWRFLALFVLFSLLALAYNSPLDLFRPLWALPYLNAISRPFKYFDFFAVLALILSGGAFFSYLEERSPAGSWRRGFLALFLGAALLPPFLLSSGLYARLPVRPVPPDTAGPFSQVAERLPGGERQRGHMYDNFKRGRGTINWYGGLLLPENAAPAEICDYTGAAPACAPAAGYRGEVYVLEPGGTASFAEFTPNRMAVDVSCPGPCTVVVNQNYDGRFSAYGGELADAGGLLGVKLASGGKRRVTLRYRWPAFYAGLAVSAVSAALLAVFVLRRRREV